MTDHLNAQAQTELGALKAMQGSAFDAAYLRDMASIHAKDGAAFALEAQRGTNPKLKAFAAETHRIVLSILARSKRSGRSWRRAVSERRRITGT